MDRVVHSVSGLIVELEPMLFLAMLLDKLDDFLFVVTAHPPITVSCQHIRAVEMETALHIRFGGAIHVVLLDAMVVLSNRCSFPQAALALSRGDSQSNYK
jgi:hypothetical protein